LVGGVFATIHIVHAEHDGGHGGLGVGDIPIEAFKHAVRGVAGYACVDVGERAIGIAGEVEQFDVLGINAVGGNAVANCNPAIAGLKGLGSVEGGGEAS